MYERNSSLCGSNLFTAIKNIVCYRFRDICDVGKDMTKWLVAQETAHFYSAWKKLVP
jgi:hypothetical protein